MITCGNTPLINTGNTVQHQLLQEYPTYKIVDAYCADNVALFSNYTTDVQKLLHTLEELGAMIGLHTNARKREYVSYNQTGLNKKI